MIEEEAAAAVSALALAQSTLMATFETRLQERDEAVQAKLQSQFDVLVSRQNHSHERMLLAVAASRVDLDRSTSAPAGVRVLNEPATTSNDINPSTTPAPREIPLQDIMTSP